MSRLIIRLLPDAGARWAQTGAGGRGGEGLPDPALAAAADEVLVLVPGEDVLLLSAPRISPRRDELERGLPFAIEERLAAPVEQLQVVAAEKDSGSRVAALVVERRRLDAWLERLQSAGLVIDRLLPETALLPFASGPSLLLGQDRFALRLAEGEALAGSRAELPALLARLPQPVSSVWLEPGASAPEALAAASTLRLDDALPRLGEGLANALGLNLLGGDYHRRRRGQGRELHRWRWAALMAAAAVLLSLIHGGIELRALQARNAQAQQAMEALYLASVPGASRVVDAESQLAAALDRLRGQGAGAGALPVLARIAPALGDPRYALDLIDYRDGALELVVRGPDVSALDALRETLSRQLGTSVELTSAVPGQGGVEARYRLRGGQP